MNIEKIEFIDSPEGAQPSRVTVSMTVQEALWVAIVAGKQRGVSPHTGIYNALVGDVFNRYWPGGVDEAHNLFRVQTPPIRYDEE